MEGGVELEEESTQVRVRGRWEEESAPPLAAVLRGGRVGAVTVKF